VKDLRVGESLWMTWDGDEYEPHSTNSYIYYTEGHVNLEEEVVKTSLASAIQRDGISYSLGESFKMLDASSSIQVYVGYIDGDYQPTVCTGEGLSVSTEVELEEIVQATIVEVSELDR